MSVATEDSLMHYGMPKRSGRYPWGSGKDPYQHSVDFLSRVEELKKSGWTETPENIEKEFGLTTTQYRMEKSICKDERRIYTVARIKSLKEDGKGATEIGRELDMTESTVRSLLDADAESRMKKTRETADFIRKNVDEKGMIEVGVGVERELNISKEKLNTALYMLEREGYPVYKGGVPQVTNKGQQTNQKVICPPGTPHKDIYKFDEIHTLTEYISRDGGETFEKKFTYPSSMDSSRLKIRYKEEGGIEKDGIIELRRGVEDLSLGESRYSQVRILVDGTHYLKGMAVYSDNMPDGVDVVFNTNKKQGTAMTDVLKKIKDDPDNPFGSAIKDADQGGQYWYTDKKTGEKKLGLINKRADEGDWNDWKDALPSQFLGKQSLAMAKKQLNLAKADKQAEYDELCSLTNPTVKKHLLQKFADECDSAAVHLQAAALPGQKYHVIIPVNTLKDTEVYAPNYENGTKLALIRYPHGGTFEIPILTVNNKHMAAKKLLGTDVIDAVGINAKIAEQLSGADFDGDTVMCIPTHDAKGKVKIAHKEPLKDLEGFDPKLAYQYDKKTVDDDGTEHYYRNGREFKVMKNTGNEMGRISNLITDMTLAGAKEEELARAVKHSMVVIDAEKHKLDYKMSEIENNIEALRRDYQPKFDENGKLIGGGGAATILSRSKGQDSVVKRQGTPHTNTKYNSKGEINDWYDPTKPEGALIYRVADDHVKPVYSTNKKTGVRTYTTITREKIQYDPSNKDEADKYRPIKRVDPDTKEISYTNKSGTIVYKLTNRTQPTTRMAETDDAYTLVSEARHPMELVYADYANSMKAMANRARMEVLSTGKIEANTAAKTTYKAEVDSLKNKLNTALLNAPRERAALRLANAEVAAKKKAYKEQNGVDMKPSDEKKISQQALTKYRQQVGGVSRKDRSIEITDREWEAIQAGAISENKLIEILNNTNVDSLRQRATPRLTNNLSTAQINRAKAMSASNFTLAEIAAKLGVSTSTVSKYLKGKE